MCMYECVFMPGQKFGKIHITLYILNTYSEYPWEGSSPSIFYIYWALQWKKVIATYFCK